MFRFVSREGCLVAVTGAVAGAAHAGARQTPEALLAGAALLSHDQQLELLDRVSQLVGYSCAAEAAVPAGL